MNIEHYLSRFKNILAIRRLQPNTIEAYLSCLRKFLVYCAENQVLPEDLSNEVLEAWLAATPSESLLRQRIGTIQNFYQHVLGIPYKLAHIPYPKKHDFKPDILSRIEVEMIIKSIKNKKQRAIIALQYYCALRVHEVVKIRLTDFIRDFDTESKRIIIDLKIRGKGGNDDIIPVQPEAIGYITDYYNSSAVKPTDYLFEGQFRGCYSERSVQEIMKRQMRELGIKASGATHILRHSRATHLLQSGASIRHVQKLLRHKNIKTTERYTHLGSGDLRNVFSECDERFFKAFEAKTPIALTAKQPN